MYRLALVSLVLLIGCQEQTSSPAVAISSQDAEALVSDYVSALNQCDLAAYNGLFHADADAFPIGPTGLIPGSELQEGLKEQCDEGIKFDMKSTEVAVRSLEDVVVTTFVGQGYRIVPPADSGAVKARFTMVLSEKDGKLSIEHLHGSPM